MKPRLGFLVVVVAFGAAGAGASPGGDPVVLLKRALLSENAGSIRDACRSYESVLALLPDDVLARAGWQRCGCSPAGPIGNAGAGVAMGSRDDDVTIEIEQIADGCVFPDGPVMDLVVTIAESKCAVKRRTYFDNRFVCAGVTPGSHSVKVEGSIGAIPIHGLTGRLAVRRGGPPIRLVVQCKGGAGSARYRLEFR